MGHALVQVFFEPSPAPHATLDDGEASTPTPEAFSEPDPREESDPGTDPPPAETPPSEDPS